MPFFTHLDNHCPLLGWDECGGVILRVKLIMLSNVECPPNPKVLPLPLWSIGSACGSDTDDLPAGHAWGNWLSPWIQPVLMPPVQFDKPFSPPRPTRSWMHHKRAGLTWADLTSWDGSLHNCYITTYFWFQNYFSLNSLNSHPLSLWQTILISDLTFGDLLVRDYRDSGSGMEGVVGGEGGFYQEVHKPTRPKLKGCQCSSGTSFSWEYHQVYGREQFSCCVLDYRTCVQLT